MSESQTAPNPRRWKALALIAAAQFMVIMDTSIIGVALPEMQKDLGFSQENLSCDMSLDGAQERLHRRHQTLSVHHTTLGSVPASDWTT